MYIDETHSTSSLLREIYDDSLPHLFTIRTDFQTAGRGQAGNSWESEKGKNLLFSTLLRYAHVHSADQWRLSMLAAVAVREAIALHLSPLASRLSPITIKWPNDIYYQDKKLVGILIENTLSGGQIAYTIAGVGLNVNQTKWLSNAPNPVSMKQITGEEYDVEDLLKTFLDSLQRWETASTEQLKEEYVRHLYRSTGWHPYMEREVSLAPTNIQLANQAADGVFLAQWVDITPQGEWVLRLQTGEEKRYHFKQIRFVL